jgi:integrase/recombinase XerD
MHVCPHHRAPQWPGVGQQVHIAASQRDGVPIEVVSTLLGHADITTTLDVCGHLTAEDARRVLQAAGWFTGREVQL